MTSNLFTVNNNGQIEYNPEVTETPVITQTSEVTPEEGEFNAAITPTPSDQNGDLLHSPEVTPEITKEVEEGSTTFSIPIDDSGSVPVVLSEEVTAAILAAQPASGSIGSSTLDYFDRVVSGLSSDYKYVAYRTDSSDSYDAVLYFGRDFDIFENSIKFKDDAVELRVDRVSTSGYNNETYYYSADASNTTISFSKGSTLLYYTNAVEGYPVLGGYSGTDLTLVPFLIGGIITAVATVILSKLILKR